MAKNPLQIGDKAPDFELFSDHGDKVKLSSFHGKRVIVYFYPKDDTPGCTSQACGFRDKYHVIEERHGVILGISPDSIESHIQFKNKYNLPFRLLVDDNHKVAEAYGVWSAGSNLRSHFVVDEAGRLADIQIKVSPEESVRLALDKLQAAPPAKG
jgi:thioredoxin-dependent peroxiredoxin